MPSAKSQAQVPDATYSSGASRNPEWFIGPGFVLFGGLFSVQLLLLPASPGSDQSAPPIWMPILFVVMGLVYSYAAFFGRASRLEIRDGTLQWFTPLRRSMGEAPVADIVSVWTGHTFQLLRTQTVIELRDGRTVSIRDSRGISGFVSALVARSADIDVADWKPREPRDHTFGGSYPTNGHY